MEKEISSSKKIIFAIFAICLVMLLVYFPHYNYSYPRHMDEWHHISEALKLGEDRYEPAKFGLELGFHIFLLITSKTFDLVSIYKFLPALWAALAALILFLGMYKKTENFRLALFSILFFATIKSNVNILGLWFFTPLTFSIPLIFAYIFLFTIGLEKQNKKLILGSILIMLLLIPTHVISLLFALPILIIYSLFHKKYIIKEKKLFSIFLIIPLIGIVFYSIIHNITLIESLNTLIEALKFKHGWGVLELKNSLLELYSIAGYILAILGIGTIILKKQNKDIFFVIWTFWMILMIATFRLTGISPLSPYQRNLYYFALSLPIISAYGLEFIISTIENKINKRKISNNFKKILKKSITPIITLITVLLIILAYGKIDGKVALYKAIDERDYQALKYLENFKEGIIIAPLEMADTVYPISKKEPLATFYFNGPGEVINQFFDGDCNKKLKIINENNVSYIYSKYPIACGFQEIYNSSKYIYIPIK